MEKILFRVSTQEGIKMTGAKMPFGSTNREMVLTAVHKYGETLFFASKDLQADRQIVLAAVNNDGFALEFVR